MSVKIENLKNQHDCTSIRRITVDGGDLPELRKLVVDVMQGGSEPDDGLAEIFDLVVKQSRADGVDVDSQAMGIQTIATRLWIDNNKALYNKLANYFLQPRVEKCKLSKENDVCKYVSPTEHAKDPASPDVYANMDELVRYLSKHPGERSVTFYLFDSLRPHCSFFGFHQGTLTFDLQSQCPK